MKILIACDKFKDCMSSKDLGLTLTNSILNYQQQDINNKINKEEIECQYVSISDGGEGFLESLIKPLDLLIQELNVTGPLGNIIKSRYGYNREKKIAVVEMALASGLELVPKQYRNPLNTTTKGTGELILHAIVNNQCNHIVIGAGGSATNDGGIGALSALGINISLNSNYIDHDTQQIICGKHLQHIKSIELPEKLKQDYKDVLFEFCTDVTTPFTGSKGAVHTFAKQKGANENDRVELEKGMMNVSSLFPIDIRTTAGTGAAGGLPGGFVALLNTKISKGMEYICQLIGLESKVRESDLIITGEGCFDSTSLHGKAVTKILDYGDQYNKQVVIVCGCLADEDETKIEEINKKWKCIKNIYDLQSRFGQQQSMNNTKDCLDRLVKSDLLINN